MLTKARDWLIWRLYDFLYGVREVRCPNGVKGRGPFYHGAGDKHGLWRFFYEDGRIWCQGEFEWGFETGVWTFCHPNGRVSARGKVDSWRRQGTWEFWDEAGCPLDEESFLARYPAAASRLPERYDKPAAEDVSNAEPFAAPDRPLE